MHRTERVNEEITIQYTSYIGRKISMQNCNSIVAIWFLSVTSL